MPHDCVEAENDVAQKDHPTRNQEATSELWGSTMAAGAAQRCTTYKSDEAVLHEFAHTNKRYVDILESMTQSGHIALSHHR